MQLRRRFPAPVARPVDAVDHEADRRGVNGVHGALKTARHAPESLAAKPRIRCGEMVQDCPEQRLRHVAVAFAIGVRECVFRGRHRIANPQQFRRMILQRVANIVQTERVRELRVEQGDHMGPGTEGPGLLVHTVFPGDLRNKVARNQLA